ncbi:MAG: sigma-70 family RNA polymerase sigma factor [Candidatus Aminicenantes bacterium]|jgi:RNA polymerase sigma-70 factor (ECF subfamily)
MAMEENDTHLVERVCAGDIYAFQEIVERYKKKIYYIAYDIVGDHHEAEDVSQEVFIKMYRALERFRKDAKMSSWLYQITVNSAIDSIRKKKVRPRINVEDIEQVGAQERSLESASPETNPERRAVSSLMQRHIEQALHKITPQERAVFVMRHYNEFKIREISDVLDVSSGTVKSLLFRALKKLRKELASTQGEYRWEVDYE